MAAPHPHEKDLRFLEIKQDGDVSLVVESEEGASVQYAENLYRDHYGDDQVNIGVASLSQGLSFWMSQETLNAESNLPVNVIASKLTGFLTGDSNFLVHGDVIVSGFFESFEHYHGLSEQQIVLLEKLLS